MHPRVATQVPRQPSTVRINRGSYVAFKIDPHASLAHLRDPATDFYTRDLLDHDHSKVYLGLVVGARKRGGCSDYELTLSVVGPTPATVSQHYASTLIPIMPSGSFYDPSVVRSPVFPTFRLPPWATYHYPTTIRVKVTTTVIPQDYTLFPLGFPRLGEEEVKRLKVHAEDDSRRFTVLRPQTSRVLQDLEPMDMATELAMVKLAIRLAPRSAFEHESPSERRDRLRLLDDETYPTLRGSLFRWEPVVTVWVNPRVVDESPAHPETLGTELALLKRYATHFPFRLPLLMTGQRIADMFNRRWVDRVRAIYVLRTSNPKDLPPIFEARPRPNILAANDVTIEHSIEGSHGGKESTADEDHSETSNSQSGEKSIDVIEEPNPVRQKSYVPLPISALIWYNIHRSRADILSRATEVQAPTSSGIPSASCPSGCEQTHHCGKFCQ